MARSIQLLRAELRDPDLEVHAVLGLGSYGVVYRGVWRGLPVAVKVLVVPAAAAGVEVLPGRAGRDARTQQRAVLEAAISLSMSHPNVVATFAYELKPLVQQPPPGPTPDWGSESISGGDGGAAPCVEEADGHKLYIVQELCNGGSLAQALAAGMAGSIIAGGLSRRLALRLVLDVALGIAHVHSCRIVHGDLKPDNVLLSSGARHEDQCTKRIVEAATGEMPHGPASAGPSIDPGCGRSPGCCASGRGVGSSSGDTLPLTLTAKVADFGLSLPLQEGATHTSNRFQGTRLYCAPEVISAGHLSAKADVWSFGLMLLELFYGCTMQTMRSLHDTVQCGLHQGRPLAAGLPQARSIEETVIEEMFKSPYLSYARMAAACLRADPRSRPTFEELASGLLDMLSIDQGIVGLYHCRIVHGDLKPDNVLLSSGARHEDQCTKRIVEAAADEMPHGPASAGPSIYPGRGPSPGRCVSGRGMGSSSGDTLPLTLTAKVADFGLSLPLQEGATHTSNRFQGTRLYCAPEVISAGHLSAKADVWSFGLMLLELFYGCMMQTIRSLHDTVQCGLHQGRPLAAGLPQARSIEVAIEFGGGGRHACYHGQGYGVGMAAELGAEGHTATAEALGPVGCSACSMAGWDMRGWTPLAAAAGVQVAERSL
ncbi:Serine/threonine-protein kinase pelle [Tetrabaena socialis]|uniref:Serine/threonine-protein kinase pelle n=1 Tax=Tetrabaena socialis TaxID=47790 RepID=A0A2J7ZPY6_9CHLO|nr:Serine/threonine-protein kinase pelle [Tetrabaena socialis]|eukprot:PNH02312.1 Serine/threonine-protein kinase pelle [Tetrabaena socialis]